MKHIMIALIKLYKQIPGRFHDRCKYYPTCSTYSLMAYERFGFWIGTWLTIKRILRCNPFSRGGYDPIPERKK